MPTPSTVLWDRDPHTGAKHDLWRHYLSAWLPILLPKFRRVIYAEGFAGPGTYNGGQPGSPKIAIQVVGSHRIQFNGQLKMDLLFVEEHGGRHARLGQELESAINDIGGLPHGVTIHPPEKADCAQALPAMLDRIGAWGSPMLVILDSFGGPDVPFELLIKIATSRAGEAIVTFGPTFLTRFGSVTEHADKGDAAFGDRDWREVVNRPADAKRAFLVEEYRRSMGKAGFSYVLGFEMVDEGGNELWLMFGTNDKLGLEKMKDAMWKVDPAYGIRYRDPHDPDQLSLDITDTPDAAPLRSMLLAHLNGASATLDQLRDYALTQTVYRPQQVWSAVHELLKKCQVVRNGTGPLKPESILSLVPPTPVQETLFG